MKKYTLPDSSSVGYVAVRESVRGFIVYVCNDSPWQAAPLLTDSAFEKFGLRQPDELKKFKYYKTREAAELALDKIAKLNNLIISNE